MRRMQLFVIYATKNMKHAENIQNIDLMYTKRVE